jgi:hypothetical protein
MARQVKIAGGQPSSAPEAVAAAEGFRPHRRPFPAAARSTLAVETGRHQASREGLRPILEILETQDREGSALAVVGVVRTRPVLEVLAVRAATMGLGAAAAVPLLAATAEREEPARQVIALS